MSVAAITWRLQSHCLATAVFAEPFFSNACLCWLHNSGSQPTNHSIMLFWVMVPYILVGRYRGFWSAYLFHLLVIHRISNHEQMSSCHVVKRYLVWISARLLSWNKLPLAFNHILGYLTFMIIFPCHLTLCKLCNCNDALKREVYCLWHQSIYSQLRTICNRGPFIGSHALDDVWASFVVVAVAHSLILRWEVTVPSRRFFTYWMGQTAGVEDTSTGGHGWVQLAVKCIAHRWSTPILCNLPRLA
jgi:hypothetical protein